MNANRGALRTDDWAVSEVVGSVLLVGITVVMAAALGLLIFAVAKPVDPVHADVSILIRPGTNGWGSGDETLVMKHLGGETIRDGQALLRYTINGVVTEIDGIDLGSAFADGSFRIGENWILTLEIPAGALIDVDLIVDTPGGASQLLATVAATTECGTDTAPPIVSSWEQLSATTMQPLDVDTDTAGDVFVSALVADACSGVDPSVSLTLFYQIGAGAVQTASMAEDPGTENRWEGTIPEPTSPGGWGDYADQNLAYWVGPLTDTAVPPNTGQSSTRIDVIQDATAYTYPASATVTLGTFPDFNNVRSSSDNLDGHITMVGQTGAPTTASFAAVSASEPGSQTHWANEGFVATSNDQYASTTSNNPGLLRVEIQDPSHAGDISQVVVNAEVSITNWANDGFSIRACNGASTTNCGGSVSGGNGNDQPVLTFTMATNWDGAPWSWTDIQNLQVEITPTRSSGPDGVWRVDYVEVIVSHTPTTYEADVTFLFPALPNLPGATYELQFEYLVANADFEIWVFDGTAFTERYNLVSTSRNPDAVTVTAAEVEAGLQVKIKNVTTPLPSAAGVLTIDYLRVHTI